MFVRVQFAYMIATIGIAEVGVKNVAVLEGLVCDIGIAKISLLALTA
jgi:hypothetical protein